MTVSPSSTGRDDLRQDSTCYIERSKVREAILGRRTYEDIVDLLVKIDALPIFTAEDFRRAAQAAVGCGKWSDIETAPQDGNPVIVWDDPVLGEAYFDIGEKSWWWANTGPGDYTAEAIYPTLWRPMPAVPSAGRCVCQDRHRRGHCTEPGCPYAAPQPASNAGCETWGAAGYWEYVACLAGEHEADQMRDMLAQKGLQIVGINDPAYTAKEPININGWKLVPDRPTEEMWQAGRSADAHPGDSYSKVWSAMFDAAPVVDDCETTSSVSSTHLSPPAATIGDIPSEPRPPASAAMGLSAGGEHDPGCQTGDFGPCDCSLSSTHHQEPAK